MTTSTYDRNFACEIRFQEDPTRESPGRMIGVLMTYGERASDRDEVFLDGALYWEDKGIVIDDSHDRHAPIVRVVPYLEGNQVKVDHKMPDTQRGRDAIVGVREGLYRGLSVAFRSEQERWRGPLREVRRAKLIRAGLVDDPAYGLRAWWKSETS